MVKFLQKYFIGLGFRCDTRYIQQSQKTRKYWFSAMAFCTTTIRVTTLRILDLISALVINDEQHIDTYH